MKIKLLTGIMALALVGCSGHFKSNLKKTAEVSQDVTDKMQEWIDRAESAEHAVLRANEELQYQNRIINELSGREPEVIDRVVEIREERVEHEDGRTTYPGVYFDTDSIDPRHEGVQAAQEIAAELHSDMTKRIIVAGHADKRGAREYNLALSLERANTVIDMLSNAGIRKDRMILVGNGEDKPFCEEDSHECYARNRVVTIREIKLQ